MMHEEKLPFPTKMLQVGDLLVEEFVIPEEKKKEVLDQLYVFSPVPQLDTVMYDLHEGKNFRVGDYRVLWQFGMNYLVSPYYLSSGGTVIDWMPTRNHGNGRKKLSRPVASHPSPESVRG